MKTAPRVYRKKSARGQGMTEYIIIVALVAIGAIGVVTIFGNNVRHLFGMAADALTGDENTADRREKSSAAVEHKGLKTVGQNN